MEYFTDFPIDLMEESVLFTRADPQGMITYANKKFCEISGWKREEVIGKNHNIVNSGVHPREFWAEMYRVTLKERRIWNEMVTNRSKSGNLYHVDTYVKAEFDPTSDRLLGFTSVRQDVTEIVQTNEKLNNLVASQTSYVLRTDMQGRHTYWNKKFEEEFGWVYGGKMMHGDSLLSICESHHGAAYNAVMECVSVPGKIVKVELDKPHYDGSRRTTLWEFVCITDKAGTPTEVQCMGIDITDRVLAEKKIAEVLYEVERKNTYLEHAAKILRHDMHSGINTYIPRGISSLERRLPKNVIESLKLEAPMKLLKEGLAHTQKIYKGVKEFTNLVRENKSLDVELLDLRAILVDYLNATSYSDQVVIGSLPTIEVNESLFCTAIDNLIRNGLKYNDSDTKCVKIFMLDDSTMAVQDNGRGMSSEDFERLSQPYMRLAGQKEEGTGIGLSICIAILREHGFSIACQKNKEGGTLLRIKIR